MLCDVDESEDMLEAGPGLKEMEDLAYFEPDDEVFDDVSEAEFELTDEELAVMKEINENEMEADVNTFLLRTENDNTRSSTNAIVTKYNRVMAIVSKKQNTKFVTLAETPQEEIPNLLARFFKMIRTKKGTLYNASSLNTFLSSFGRYFAECFDPPIDLKNDIRFRQVKTTVARMKKAAQGTKDKKPGANASRAVAPRHLRLAWARGHIGRDSPDALNSATYLAFTTGLGCRAVREVHSVTNGSLIIGPIGSGGVPEYIELDEQWVVKNRVGKDARLLEARVHPDHEHPETCYVRTIMEMLRRKTERQSLPDAKFWWNVKETARENPLAEEKWFKNNHAGKHSLEKMLINSLTLSGIDCKKEKYTATSTRKSMMDGGQDAGIPETILGRKAGHRSDHSKRSYIQNKDITHRATNIVLSRVGAGKTANYQDVLNKLKTADEVDIEKASGEADIIETAKKVEYYDDDFEYTISQSRMVMKEANVETEVKLIVTTSQTKLTNTDHFELAPPGLKVKGGDIKVGDSMMMPSSSPGQQRSSMLSPAQQMSGTVGLGQQISGTGTFSPYQHMFHPGQQMSPGQQMMSGMFSPGQQMMSGMFSPGQQMMPGMVSPGQHQQMSGMFSPGQHPQMMPGMVSPAQQRMSDMFSPGQQSQMMPGMFSHGQQMIPSMFSHGRHQMMPGMFNHGQQMMPGMFSPGQPMMPGMFNPSQHMVPDMLSPDQSMMPGQFYSGNQMMPDLGQKTIQSMVNTSQQMTGVYSPDDQMRQVMFRPGEQMVSPIQPISPGHPVSGVLSTEQEILAINSSGLDLTPNTLVGGSSASAYQVPSLKGPRQNSPIVETNVTVAESVPVAENLNKSVPVAVKLNKSAPAKLTGKENIEVCPGAVMLHKLKGFPYWPAKITDIKDGR